MAGSVALCLRPGTSEYLSAPRCERAQAQVSGEANAPSARPIIGAGAMPIVAGWGLLGLLGRIKMRGGGCPTKGVLGNWSCTCSSRYASIAGFGDRGDAGDAPALARSGAARRPLYCRLANPRGLEERHRVAGHGRGGASSARMVTGRWGHPRRRPPKHAPGIDRADDRIGGNGSWPRTSASCATRTP